MTRPESPIIKPPPEGEERYRMSVAYDGLPFRGFAKNPGVETVEGLLLESIEKVLRVTPVLVCAGRTDAGVHAKAQVISFDAAPFEIPRLQKALNSLCSPAVVVTSIEKTEEDFNARFSAISRTYRYQVLNQENPDPFRSAYSWHVSGKLSVEAMNLAGSALIGEHDFSSFCRKRTVEIEGKEIETSLKREVKELRWEVIDGNGLELWITASAFCHQMVRSIAGTLIDIGLGKLQDLSISEILNARDRNKAGRVAPPYGLTLWEVEY